MVLSDRFYRMVSSQIASAVDCPHASRPNNHREPDHKVELRIRKRNGRSRRRTSRTDRRKVFAGRPSPLIWQVKVDRQSLPRAGIAIGNDAIENGLIKNHAIDKMGIGRRRCQFVKSMRGTQHRKRDTSDMTPRRPASPAIQLAKDPSASGVITAVWRTHRHPFADTWTVPFAVQKVALAFSLCVLATITTDVG